MSTPPIRPSVRARHASAHRAFVAALALVVPLAFGGCGVPEGVDKGPRVGAGAARDSGVGQPAPSSSPDAPPTVEAPGPLAGPLRAADLLVYGATPFSADQVERIAATTGVTAHVQFSLAQAQVEDRILTIAAAPAEFRRFTPQGTAQLQEVWDRVAGGELAVDEAVETEMTDPGGNLPLGNDATSPRLHVGARAALVPQVNLVVNEAWGTRLGMPQDNAVLVSTGLTSPQRVKKALADVVGPGTSVQVLGPDLDTSAVQTAVLTGGSVAQAVGSFNYSVIGGGRIQPDPAWEAANIRTETVPILGRVRCHRAALPQLRAALTEVVQRGLADKIHPGEYAGCYYPRFIANTTSLSNHSFGTALDINVPGNQRGTVGEIDRTVVEIFKKWGFAWGGDWNWTDPMHFELARLVEVR